MISQRFEPDQTETQPTVAARGPYGALYRSGTSRILVLESSRLGAAPHPRAYLLAALTGSDGRGGVGDEHYQTNKVAVIAVRDRERVEFQFFQADRERRRLIDNLECSNSAAAAAAYALAHRLVDGPRVVTVNRDTGRAIAVALAPSADPGLAEATLWFGSGALRSLGSVVVELDGRAIRCALVFEGHFFLLVADLPESRWNDDAARVAGVPEVAALSAAHGADDDHLKVVAYRYERDGRAARAACYYKGQRHRSLPGSGAIVLARHLLSANGAAAQPRSLELVSHAQRVRVTFAEGPIERAPAGLTARVELLMAGWLGSEPR